MLEMVFTAQQDTIRNNSTVYCSDTPTQSKFCTNSPHRTITVRIFFMFEKKMSSLFLDTRFHSNRKYGFLIFVGAMAFLAFRYWKFWVFRYPRTYPAFTQSKRKELTKLRPVLQSGATCQGKILYSGFLKIPAEIKSPTQDFLLIAPTAKCSIL